MASESVKDESGASKPRSIDSGFDAQARSGSSAQIDAEQQSDQPNVQTRLEKEFNQAVTIGNELIGCLKSYSELIGLELLLAFKSLFSFLGSWLLLLLALLFTWISFSLLLAWSAYSLSGVPIAGFFVLFVMQTLLSFILWFSVKRYRHCMTMSESRRQFKTIMQGVRNELNQTGEAKESDAKPPKGDTGQ